MKKLVIWPKKLSNGFLHEKTVFISLLFLLIVLSFDCFFQNLPISGYALVLTTLILIGCTTWLTCHGIKWALNSNKPFGLHVSHKSKIETWFAIFNRWEDDFMRKIFSFEKSFESFCYPTSLNEQTRLLIKDIEKDFVKIWYSEISQNPSFLFDSHLILEEIFFKLIKKLKTVNCKNLLLSILILYLNHLQEYKKSIKKLVKLNTENESKPKTNIEDLYKYVHPGSHSDQILNFYLGKFTKSLLKEFAPHEFANSLQCKILSGVVARKVFRKLLTTIEDPNWINLKVIFLLNSETHKEILKEGAYVVAEKPIIVEEEEFHFKKSALLNKRYLSNNLFDSSRNLFERNGFHSENGAKEVESYPVKTTEKEPLILPLSKTKLEDSLSEEPKGNISTVLSGLISSTAGPLLPDNITVRYHALNKMWQSPVNEVKKEISESITNSFRKVFFDSPKEKNIMTRSKSTESFAEISGSLRTKDISVGEELCENVRLAAGETSAMSFSSQKIKKLTKTWSFDTDSLPVEDETDTKEVTVKNGKISTSDNQGDVSPVYEEPEDFATTIAKLRSLLQQRESSSTLSDNSKSSVDSQSIGFSMDRSDSTKSQSLEGDHLDYQNTCDIPTDGRLFINLSIPKGELITDSTGSYVLYSIQYDGIYMLKDEQNPSSDSELVLQTTVVRRRFQEFLRLQAKLEENSHFRSIMKGITGPSNWLSLPSSSKSDEPFTSSRRLLLENFLRQLCSKIDITNSLELHEFLAYGHNENDANVKKHPESSLQRIDKILANKVTGVFNSIKTVLPSFDFDSTALIATNDTVKSFQEQKLLQGFLNFGNKPECYELNLSFAFKEPTGESLADNIRHYFSGKSDCIEDAVDVLDSSDWLSDQRECSFISADDMCVWHGYKDVISDDELDTLDAWLPILSLFLDIFCELLQDSDSWIVKEPVVRLVKVFYGHWEEKLAKELSKLDWDRIFGNVIRLLRCAIFQSEGLNHVEIMQDETKRILQEIILSLMPNWFTEFVKPNGISTAVALFVDSFQCYRINRDVLLRLMDILLVHILSCSHLTQDS